VARHDPVKVLIGAVEGCRIANTKVNWLVCLFGFAPGSIDHLRSEIDPGNAVAEFRKPQRQEACAAPNVQYLLRRRPNESRKQIEPRTALSIADQPMARLVVEGVRPTIPVMPNDLGDLVEVLAHIDPPFKVCRLRSPYPDSVRRVR
jgi:hypothetical protein